MTSSKKFLNKPASVTLACMAILIFAGTAAYIWIDKQPVPENSSFVFLSGLPDGAAFDATVQTADGLQALEKTAHPFNLDLPHGKTLSLPYRIAASLQMPWGGYQDLTLTLDKNGGLTVLADGFDAYDELTLTFDGQSPYSNVPMDWSGRLELTASLPRENPVHACVYIYGRLQSLGLCHTLTERPAA